MNVASVIVRLPSCRCPSHHKIPQTNLSNRQAELILSFYKSPCQLLLTLWAGTRTSLCPVLSVTTVPIPYCLPDIDALPFPSSAFS